MKFLNSKVYNMNNLLWLSGSVQRICQKKSLFLFIFEKKMGPQTSKRKINTPTILY